MQPCEAGRFGTWPWWKPIAEALPSIVWNLMKCGIGAPRKTMPSGTGVVLVSISPGKSSPVSEFLSLP